MNGHTPDVLAYLDAPVPDEEEWVCPDCGGQCGEHCEFE